MGLHRLPNRNVRGMTKRIRRFRVTLALIVILLCSTVASVKGGRPTQLNGYKAVRVHYSPLNKMIMPARINGQRANLLVDTGASQVILNAAAAASFGIRPSQGSLGYIRFTQINGEELPVGFAQNLTAGTMSFGSLLVALRNSNHPGAGDGRVDGILGLDLLTQHKAVINCWTKLIFLKVDQTRQMNLSSVAAAAKFTRVHLRRERNGALTVPCSIHGRPARLFVDTGSFISIFDEAFLKSVGIPMEATRVSAHFTRGAARKINAGQINDLKIGDFKISTAKFGVTALPNFTLLQGGAKLSGFLGMDTLYNCHGIIDLDGMNLFLK
jgi:predicted aspartyl protease